MGNCDLCGKIISSDAKKYPASQFQKLVRAGLRPPDSQWKIAALKSGGQATKAEWLGGWVQMVQRDTTDWALCASCVSKADSYKSQNGKCFIATATYGNSAAPEISLLSRYRDEILMKSNFGRMLIRIYYTLSPSLADFIAPSQQKRAFIRLLIRPILYLCLQHLKKL